MSTQEPMPEYQGLMSAKDKWLRAKGLMAEDWGLADGDYGPVTEEQEAPTNRWGLGAEG